MFLSGRPNMYYTVIVYEKDSLEEMEDVRHSHYAPKFRTRVLETEAIERVAFTDLNKGLNKLI